MPWTAGGWAVSLGNAGPLPPFVGDDRHCLFVVARQHAFDPTLSRGLEGDPIADLELQHLRMCPHLVEKAQPRDNAMVEIDEFGLGQLVDVDLYWGPIAHGWAGGDPRSLVFPAPSLVSQSLPGLLADASVLTLTLVSQEHSGVQ